MRTGRPIQVVPALTKYVIVVFLDRKIRYLFVIVFLIMDLDMIHLIRSKVQVVVFLCVAP